VKTWRVAIALIALTAGLVVWSTLSGAQASRVQSCAAIRTASEARRTEVMGTGTRIAVIGDSYAQGTGLADPADSWPSRLPGRVVVDGFSGSGFSAAASPCQGVAYALRVARALTTDPDLVVVEGGLNDFDVSAAALRSGARRTLRLLRGHPTMLVGPAAAPRRLSAVDEVDTVLSEVASEAGVPYARASSWELDYLPDRLHLTAEGHRALGDAVAALLPIGPAE
jgi:acyl-CoA thioesterase I